MPMMMLIEELKKVLPIYEENPKLNYTIFEDNNSCIELVKWLKTRPYTKHIGLKYHHFRSKVKEGLIKVKYVCTKNQLDNILPKTLAEPLFLKLRKETNGW